MKLLSRLCLVATVVAVLPVMGQEPTATTPESEKVRELPPVIVTPSRESMLTEEQETPSAITHLSSRLADDAAIVSVADLPALVPNLALSRSVARSFGDIYAIRGVANTQFFSDPSVVLYVDDAPAGGAFSYATDLFEIERIDVWRGPQGAVFGKNSEAGVINIVTRRPTNRYAALGTASYGSFDTQTYRAGVMGPIIKDTLYFSLAGRYSLSDGFLFNPLLKIHPDEQSGFDGRLALEWVPAEDWDISLNVTGATFEDGVRFVPLTGDIHQVSSDFEPEASTASNAESLRISRSFPAAIITSITTRQDFELDPLLLDLDLSPIPGNTALIKQSQEQWSEELRLQSPSDAEAWKWRAGFFFATSEHKGEDTRNYIVPVAPDVYMPVEAATAFRLDEDNYAIFGQATYAVWDKLAVTFGTRFDYTVKRMDRTKTYTFGPVPPVHDKNDYFNVAPKLTIDCQWTERIVAYGSTGLGFKPGGFSAYIDPPDSPRYDTELNWSSEIGLKSSWCDDKFLANIALFYSDIQDYQVERQITGTTDLTIFNAPEVTALGVELEVIGRPLEGLELSAVFGYTDIQFDRFIDPVTSADLKGNRPPSVPEFNLLLAAQYKHRCGFFARVEYQALGQTYFEETNQAFFRQSSYGLLNARVGYEARYFSVFLFGRNLTDTEYFTKIVPDLYGGVPGTPQTVGVMVSVKY